jgi:hypothetical protein
MFISLFALGIFSIFALFSSIFVSMIYAQIFPGPHTASSTNPTNLTPSFSHPILKQQHKQIQPVPHFVKIVSPVVGGSISGIGEGPPRRIIEKIRGVNR